VTHLKHGEIFNSYFIANLLLSVLVKEFWKSCYIWWSYDKNLVAYFFDSRCTFWKISLQTSHWPKHWQGRAKRTRIKLVLPGRPPTNSSFRYGQQYRPIISQCINRPEFIVHSVVGLLPRSTGNAGIQHVSWFQSPYSCWCISPETFVNNRINLILRETRVPGLHFCRWLTGGYMRILISRSWLCNRGTAPYSLINVQNCSLYIR